MNRFAPLTGVVFAVLFGVGSALWYFDAPESVGDPAEIAQFYIDHSTAVIVGSLLALVGTVFFIVFAAVVHRVLSNADGSGGWLPTVALLGAAGLVAAGFAAESINAAAALRADEDVVISAQAAQIYFDISQVFGFPVAGVGIAAFTGAIGLVALRTGQVIPHWLALVTMALALISIILPLAFIGVFAFAPWVAIVSLVLFARLSPSTA